ncbi:MAG: modification methylase, partial [Labilithrix sp.]|nr:modification methylase [Labilithrix sp.]
MTDDRRKKPTHPRGPRREPRPQDFGRDRVAGRETRETRETSEEAEATEGPALGVVPATPPARRRSLTNVGGEIETSGDPAMAKVLAHAIDVAPNPDEAAEDRAHVHGFHAYPARAHPVTVRRLIEDLVPEGGTVLDPFCGSGTVLVEAMLAGRATIGSDLNPIAILLARAKTYPRPPEKTQALVDAARGVAAH